MQKEPIKKGADASFLPSYYYSPWKEGREEEEQKELLQVEEISLSKEILGVGNYTFYGCSGLRKLNFTDSLQEIGGGSFTGCTALRELTVEMEEGALTCLQDVVSETFHEVYVELIFRNSPKKARLIFPEYYEEGVENTPARLLETCFHGSGYRYRQCFTGRSVDFAGYDALFPVAKVYEKKEILIPMAMGRLLYPYGLSLKAGKVYGEYLARNLENCVSFYLDRKDWHRSICFLAEETVTSEEELKILLESAVKHKQTEAVSLLMEIKNRRFPGRKKKFEF